MDEHINDWNYCEFCERSYYESDTGYSEYTCALLDCDCLGEERCPLSFKYEICKEDKQ